MRFVSWLAFFAMLLGFVSALSIPHHQRRSTELDERLVLSLDHLNFCFSRWTKSFRKGGSSPLRSDEWLQRYGPQWEQLPEMRRLQRLCQQLWKIRP